MSKHIQTGQQRGGSPIIFKSGEPISVICVASTFTSLSYANNGGKVQITSSGVHGLTTSPAVGAKVWVDWSGGTGISGLYTVLSVNSTTTITIDLTYAAGLGTPNVASLGTIIEVYRQTIAPLGKKSHVEIYGLITMPSATYLRAASVKAGPLLNTIQAVSTSSSTYNSIGLQCVFQNINSTANQISNTTPGIGAMASSATSTNIDTSVPFDITANLYINAANAPIILQQLVLKVFL